MIETPRVRAVAIGVLVAIAASSAAAGVRTTVDLAGNDDSVRKLGVPGISVEVTGASPADAATVRSEVARELGKIVFTRPLRPGEPGDYALDVRLEPGVAAGNTATIPFSAALTSADGAALWRIHGRTEVENAPVDAGALLSIARNVVSALAHDGWVQPRYDVDDPPPPPPNVRHE